MRILVRDGNALIKSTVFAAKPITIGSDKSCDIHLPDSRVLPQQATLVPQPDGTWRLESGAENQSTRLNGRPVLGSAPIQHADEVCILNYTIAVYRATGEAADGKASPATMVSTEASMLRAHPLPPGSIVKHASDALTLDGGQHLELARFALLLRKCTDAAKLIDFALDTLLGVFGGRSAFVGVRRNNYGPFELMQGRNIQGHTTGEPPAFANYFYRCLEVGQHICIPAAPYPDIGSAMVVPMSCDRGELGMLYVDRKKGAATLEIGDLDRLIAYASHATAQLEKIVLEQIQVQESVQQGKLSFMREIQTRMDPATVPQWEAVQLAVYCKPGLERGGDVYDVMRLPNGLGAVLVATVTGEGTSAALAMAQARAAFRIAGLHADPPHIYLRSFNWLLAEDRASCTLHAAVLVINPRTGVIEYSTAGDAGAVIVDDRGELRELAVADAPAGGTVRGFNYAPRSERVGPGETLALFTPGCYSVLDSQGEALGQERFLDSICDGFGQSANIALDELLRDQASFFKEGRQPDDITILLLHRIGAPA